MDKLFGEKAWAITTSKARGKHGIGLTEDAQALADWLKEKAGYRVTIHTPFKGESRKLCDMARENAEVRAAAYAKSTEKSEKSLVRLASLCGLEVIPEVDFRERATGDITGIDNFAVRQWADKSFAAPGGEGIAEVQDRVAAALRPLVEKHKGEAIAIGCHGTMLGATVNYFDGSFDLEAFGPYRNLMPWIVEMTFEDGRCTGMVMVDPFHVK